MADEVTQYGIWFNWTDTTPEWLCDRAGVVFVFDKKYEAEAIRDLLHPGNGTVVEVKPYGGEAPTRAYPWPEQSLNS
jgi:hypothetical protein